VVTGGMDGRVIVWDKNMGITNMFDQAHPSGVICVACNKQDNQVFATAGLDGKIKVWNLKNIKSCRTVYTDELEPAGAVSWVPGQPGVLLVASRTGKVFLLDTESKTVGEHFPLMDREIRNIRWSVDRPDLCALAGDDVTVHVIKVQQQNISLHYSNQSHKDFVRGLAWHPSSGVLWSSGWDGEVKHHQVS
jgi:WD40 repeat protein